MSGAGRLYQPRNPDWERVVRESFARQAYMGLIGARLAEVHPGRVTIELPYRDDLCQQRGFLHGGVTTAIADSAAGYAAFTLMPPSSSPLTVELKINLLAPATGERFFRDGAGSALRQDLVDRRRRCVRRGERPAKADRENAGHPDLS